MVKIKDICAALEEQKVDYNYIGDLDLQVTGFSSLSSYKEGTVTWCKNINYVPEVPRSFTLVVVEKNSGTENVFANRIETANPKKVFFSIVEHFFGEEEYLPDVGHGTIISPDVKIGNNVKIGHNCTLVGNIIIGDNTIIYNNVNIINKVTIGRNCIIQSGVNIGHDDFAYTEDSEARKTMIKHYGGVSIGDDVYIAANCVINRGTIDDTVICDGVKIDAQCQISHNVNLGKNSALISGSRLYGSVKTGENVYIASAIIKNQLTVGSNVIVGMGSVVLDNIEEGAVVVGTPARKIR